MADRRAPTDHSIHELLANRWSPYAFDERPVAQADLNALFEAARWAASSYNEQPWSYIVGTQADRAQFDRIHACLVEGNQAWTARVPVLALGVVQLNFSRNGNPNRAAVHDLGLASAGLTFEAAARGICVHQMIGILPEKARELFAIPAGYEAWTGLAIGYHGDSSKLPEHLAARDAAPRTRKPLSEFVFTGNWGAK